MFEDWSKKMGGGGGGDVLTTNKRKRVYTGNTTLNEAAIKIEKEKITNNEIEHSSQVKIKYVY